MTSKALRSNKLMFDKEACLIVKIKSSVKNNLLLRTAFFLPKNYLS